MFHFEFSTVGSKEQEVCLWGWPDESCYSGHQALSLGQLYNPHHMLQKTTKKHALKLLLMRRGSQNMSSLCKLLIEIFFKNYTKNKIITLKIFLHTYRHIFHPPRHVAADIHHICLQLFLEDTDTGPGSYRKTIPSPQDYNHTANNDHQLVLGYRSNHQHICHEIFENICTTQK